MQPVQYPTVSKYNGVCSQWYNEVAKYDWDIPTALAIMRAESGCNPNAENPKDNHMSWAKCMGSYGLFQLNCSHGKVLDGASNIKIAYQMYKSWGSWKPWTTYTSGKYKAFL